MLSFLLLTDVHGFAASRILEVHGQRMIDNNFTPGAKATAQHKDMTQAVELGMHYHLELPITELGKELFIRLIKGAVPTSSIAR